MNEGAAAGEEKECKEEEKEVEEGVGRRREGRGRESSEEEKDLSSKIWLLLASIQSGRQSLLNVFKLWSCTS